MPIPDQDDKPTPGCSHGGGGVASTDQSVVVKKTTASKQKKNVVRDVVCVHDTEGTCNIHGPGAKEMSKPVRVTRTFKNGNTRSVMTSQKWWKCDLGMRGGRLRQTSLSFGVVSEARGAGNRDNKGNLGQRNSSVGQHKS